MDQTGSVPDAAKEVGARAPHCGPAAARCSIVTVSFNQGAFLGECLASVLGQRACGALEYVVVDPGSTDGSRAILARHAHAIDALVLEPDAGPADGLNRGFARSSGDVLGYINADDRLAPGAVEYVLQWFAEHPDVDVLCGTVRIVDRAGRPSLRARTADAFDLARYAAGICTVGQQGTFFRRRAFAAVGGFNPANRINWDGELLVDMALAGMRFATTARILGDFRVYPEALSSARRDLQRREHERIAAKIAAQGAAVYPPLEAAARRFLYRINAARHARYVLANRG